MVIKISNLEHLIISDKNDKDNAKKISDFEFVYNMDLREKFQNIEGHLSIEEAWDFVQNKICDVIVPMALKESMDRISLDDKEYMFKYNGEDKDLRDFIFCDEILDKDSEVSVTFKSFLKQHWDEEFEWYYFLSSHARNSRIHEDKDKKTLFNHYYDTLEEFNEGISFLEYYNKKTIDHGSSMFSNHTFLPVNENGDYYVIDDTITRKELNNYLNSELIAGDDNVFNVENFNTLTWFAFGNYYGINHGLNEYETYSFSSILTMILTGLDVHDFINRKIDTKEYFKEDLITKVIYQLDFDDESIDNKVKKIFYTIYDIFKNKIQDFEYKNKRLEFRVSQRQYDKFMSLTGKTKADKLEYLIHTHEIVNNSLLPNMDFDEESIEKWINDSHEPMKLDIFREGESREDMLARWEKERFAKRFGEHMEVNKVHEETGYQTPEELWMMEDMYRDYLMEQENEKMMQQIEEMRKELEELHGTDEEKFKEKKEEFDKLVEEHIENLEKEVQKAQDNIDKANRFYF